MLLMYVKGYTQEGKLVFHWAFTFQNLTLGEAMERCAIRARECASPFVVRFVFDVTV